MSSEPNQKQKADVTPPPSIEQSKPEVIHLGKLDEALTSIKGSVLSVKIKVPDK